MKSLKAIVLDHFNWFFNFNRNSYKGLAYVIAAAYDYSYYWIESMGFYYSPRSNTIAINALASACFDKADEYHVDYESVTIEINKKITARKEKEEDE